MKLVYFIFDDAQRVPKYISDELYDYLDRNHSWTNPSEPSIWLNDLVLDIERKWTEILEKARELTESKKLREQKPKLKKPELETEES